jgi:hypothetical protein
MKNPLKSIPYKFQLPTSGPKTKVYFKMGRFLTVIAYPSDEDIHREKLHVCIDYGSQVNFITVGAFQRIKHHVASDPVSKVYAFGEEDAVAALGGFRIRTIGMVQ